MFPIHFSLIFIIKGLLTLKGNVSQTLDNVSQVMESPSQTLENVSRTSANISQAMDDFL